MDGCVAQAMRPPSFNSNNLEPNRKLKKGVVVTTPPNTANTTHEVEIYNTIPEEEAVCRFCFHQLFPVDINNNNVMKTKCGCPLTLTHENCANNKKKCDMCDQDVGYIRVTLSRASCISKKKEVDDKGSSSRSRNPLNMYNNQ
ncbi:hypothetical protein ACJIZ3_023926 [Penstemon smallii]|uniref:RING-CH-type domain-containing protein n=1 Tax=Penstemon smallii TaxID=265156 RepID=A0ABD3TSQ8_9LAMI